MHRKIEIRLENLAFHYFRDEPAYKSYITAMKEIFAECTKDEMEDNK